MEQLPPKPAGDLLFKLYAEFRLPKTLKAASRQLSRWVAQGLQLNKDPSFANSAFVISTREELCRLLGVFITTEALRSRGYTEQALTQPAVGLASNTSSNSSNTAVR